MSLKTPRERQYWDPFWGCTMYPLCKGTRNCDIETGAAMLTPKEIEEKRMNDYLEAVNNGD